MDVYTPSRSDPEGDIDPVKLRLIYFSNEFPYDDLNTLFRGFFQQSKDRSHLVLAHFLDEATLALRGEVEGLPAELKKLIPPFESILHF